MASTLVQKENETSIRPFFEDFFNLDPFRAFTSTLPRYMVPALDVYSKDGSYVIELAVPGFDKKDIDIDINGNNLTVSGKYSKETEDREKDKRYHYRELRKGSFSRSVTLPENIDAGKVSATFDAGVLKIEMPAQRVAESKKVAIK
jgi:HSP20 family protein